MLVYSRGMNSHNEMVIMKIGWPVINVGFFEWYFLTARVEESAALKVADAKKLLMHEASDCGSLRLSRHRVGGKLRSEGCNKFWGRDEMAKG